MIKALLLGAAAQSSLILSGLVVYVLRVPQKVVGGIAGYGAGALIGAIAFTLVPESSALSTLETAAWLLAGALVYLVSDAYIERRFGGDQAGPLGIVVGSVVDGVPESVIFGIQVAMGQGISASFLAAVFVSNVPQALAPSSELSAKGWRPMKLTLMWGGVVLACGLASGFGYFIADLTASATGARAAALAAGGLLAMLTDSLIPFSYEKGRAQAGFWAAVGFAASLAAS